jgi:DNA-directed RNA polymerase subunit H (RpoH/RPB5)
MCAATVAPPFNPLCGTPHWSAILACMHECGLASSIATQKKAGVSSARAHALRVASVLLWNRGYSCLPDQVPADAEQQHHMQQGVHALCAAMGRIDANQSDTCEGWAVVARVHATCTFMDGSATVCGDHERRGSVCWLATPAPGHDKLSKQSVTTLVNAALMGGADRLFIVLTTVATFTYHCKEALRDRCEFHQRGLPVEVVEHSALCHVKPLHALVPHHTVVPSDKVADTLKKWRQSPIPALADKLPQLLPTDPIVLWYGWRPGTIVQYTARLGSGSIASTRVCRVKPASATTLSKKHKATWLVM